eukprot:2041673-Alexandrium_andersonii.AAC.1
MHQTATNTVSRINTLDRCKHHRTTRTVKTTSTSTNTKVASTPEASTPEAIQEHPRSNPGAIQEQ